MKISSKQTPTPDTLPAVASAFGDFIAEQGYSADFVRKYGDSAHAFCEQDRQLLRDTLDTTLFRGEGEAFEPMHRTVAEYLAGHALAEAVVGNKERAALPLSGAFALITGFDGGAARALRLVRRAVVQAGYEAGNAFRPCPNGLSSGRSADSF